MTWFVIIATAAATRPDRRPASTSDRHKVAHEPQRHDRSRVERHREPPKRVTGSSIESRVATAELMRGTATSPLNHGTHTITTQLRGGRARASSAFRRPFHRFREIRARCPNGTKSSATDTVVGEPSGDLEVLVALEESVCRTLLPATLPSSCHPTGRAAWPVAEHRSTRTSTRLGERFREHAERKADVDGLTRQGFDGRAARSTIAVGPPISSEWPIRSSSSRTSGHRRGRGLRRVAQRRATRRRTARARSVRAHHERRRPRPGRLCSPAGAGPPPRCRSRGAGAAARPACSCSCPCRVSSVSRCSSSSRFFAASAPPTSDTERVVQASACGSSRHLHLPDVHREH